MDAEVVCFVGCNSAQAVVNARTLPYVEPNEMQYAVCGWNWNSAVLTAGVDSGGGYLQLDVLLTRG